MVFSTTEPQKKSLIHLTSKKKCFFLILKNCGIMKPCKNSAFFLDVFYINFQHFCAKTRGAKSSSEAEDCGWSVIITMRIWDLWHQQRPKSAMFLVTLFHAEHFSPDILKLSVSFSLSACFHMCSSLCCICCRLENGTTHYCNMIGHYLYYLGRQLFSSVFSTLLVHSQ
jgi:hypothetical protein